MSDSPLQAVRGMNDILPDEAERWLWFEDTVRGWLDSYGYRNIRMPLLEPTALFKRAIGEVTDIVEKEMYSFADSLNGDQLTLRPEGTASCVRAALQHNLLYNAPQRLYYSGAMFRHERPQKGRYRQFHQIGVEALGFAGPDIDAEQILMCARLWRQLGLRDITLQLNTLGDAAARQRHRAKLIKHFEQHSNVLDADATRRLHSNPLRILDSKNPAMQQVIAAAPGLMDELEADALTHFDAVQQILRRHDIAFEINPRLVRGLDYYNRTVFEWTTTRLGAQGTVCAGGRFDSLIEQIGGQPAPACGFAMGIERLLALVQEDGSVTNLTEHFVGKRKHQTRKQEADATIERVLKGTAPQRLHLTFEEHSYISCRPTSLSEGRFLLFLRREGPAYVRTDRWYSQATIATNQVHLLLNPPVDLKTAVNQIEKIVQSQ